MVRLRGRFSRTADNGNRAERAALNAEPSRLAELHEAVQIGVRRGLKAYFEPPQDVPSELYNLLKRLADPQE